MHVQCFFEQGHDHDHQDHFGQLGFQIVQIADLQNLAGGLAAVGLVDVADEQLVQASEKISITVANRKPSTTSTM